MHKASRKVRLNGAVRLLVASLFIMGQTLAAMAAQTTPSPAPTQPVSRLNIVIVEGEGAINNIQQRVARIEHAVHAGRSGEGADEGLAVEGRCIGLHGGIVAAPSQRLTPSPMHGNGALRGLALTQ